MTSSAVSASDSVSSPVLPRAWRSAIFAYVDEHAAYRRRSGTDAVQLIMGVVLTLVILVAYRSDPRLELWWVHIAVPPPNGVAWLLTFLFLLGTIGTGAVLILFALVARRRNLTIDLVAAIAVGLGLSYGVQWLFGVTAGRPHDAALNAVDTGFPVPILAAVIAMGIVGRPYLARSVRRFAFVVIAAGVLGALTTGRGLPLALLGSLVIGWCASLVVRLWRGAPRSTISSEAMMAALSSIGIEIDTLTFARDEVRTDGDVGAWGVERVSAHGIDGTLRVSAYGRDARDAEMLSSLWRLITTRHSGVTPFVGRQQQAEHEALAVTTVHQATGGAAPELVGMASTVATNDVLVIARPVKGVSLNERRTAGSISDPEIASVVELLGQLRDHRVALVDIDLDNILLREGRAVVRDTLNTQINALEPALDRDLASALVLVATLSDVTTAVSLCAARVGDEALARALSYLQRPALAEGLRDLVKKDKELLAALRHEGASRLNVPEPELAPLRRVSGATIVLTIGTLIGGWALLGVFLNVAASFSTLKGASWGWVALVFVLSQATFLALATCDMGSVTGPLPFGRLVALEVANTFSGLAVGTVAVLAARVRFFQREGYNATVAVSSGVLTSISSWIVKGGLFIVALPFAWHNLHFAASPTGGGSHSKIIHLILLAIVAAAILVTLAVAIPRWRRVVSSKLAPKYHEIRDHLTTLAAQPRKLFEVFGGNIAAQLLVALALGASLHAFDQRLPMSTLLVVLTLGSMLGGVSPVPGGMGVVEAGMILGLTAAGIPQSEAVAAVFVQRLFTSYLPPVWGYVVLLWLRRHEYL